MSGSKRLQRARFPMCCGATILYGFGHDRDDEVPSPTKSQIREFLREYVDLTDTSDWANRQYGDMCMGAFHMAILNDPQQEALHDLFVEEGFEVVSSGHNLYLGNDIHLYVRKVKH
jgi:hypothetical protein